MNVLVLAASVTAESGGELPPPCLSEISGEPLLQLIARSTSKFAARKHIYAFSKSDIDYWNLDSVVEQLTPACAVIAVEKPTAGALCTALLATTHICNEDDLLIVSANELVRADLGAIVQGFREQGADCGVMYFESVHPRYAFASINSAGLVTQVAERRPISRNALPGVFWFARGRDFVEAAKKVILKDNALRGVFYISSTLNELILAGRRIVAVPIAKAQYIPLKTTRLQERFENLAMDDDNENS